MAATDVVTHTWRAYVQPPTEDSSTAATPSSHGSEDVDMGDARPSAESAPPQRARSRSIAVVPVRKRLKIEEAVCVFMEADAVNAFIASAVEYWKGSDAFDSLDSVDAFTYALFEGLLSGQSGFSIDLICKRVLIFGRAELALPYSVFSVDQLNVLIDLDAAAESMEAPSMHRAKRMTPAAATIPDESLPPVLVNTAVWEKHVLPGRSRAGRRHSLTAADDCVAGVNESAVILENKTRRIRVLCVETRHVITIHQHLRRGQFLAEYVFQELFGDDASPTQHHMSSVAAAAAAAASASSSGGNNRQFLLQFFEEHHKALYKLACDAGNEEGAHALIALCRLFEDDVRPETQYDVLNAARILRTSDAADATDIDMTETS